MIDTNQTLIELRAECKGVLLMGAEPVPARVVAHIISLFRDLDEALQNGDLLPAAWVDATPPKLKDGVHNTVKPEDLPTDQTRIIVVGANTWGRGKTFAEALKECQRANSNRAVRDYLVYRVGHRTKVDDLGGFTTEPNDDGTYTSQTLVFRRRKTPNGGVIMLGGEEA